MQVADKQDIDVSLSILDLRFSIFLPILAVAVEHYWARLRNSLAMHRFDSSRVGQNEIATAEDRTIMMPKQVPIGSQADNRNRREPQTCGDTCIGQVKDDEFQLPIGRQTCANCFPGISRRDVQVHIAGGVESPAITGLSDSV